MPTARVEPSRTSRIWTLADLPPLEHERNGQLEELTVRLERFERRLSSVLAVQTETTGTMLRQMERLETENQKLRDQAAKLEATTKEQVEQLAALNKQSTQSHRCLVRACCIAGLACSVLGWIYR